MANADMHAHRQRLQSKSHLQAHQRDVHRVGGGQRREQPPLVRQVLEDVFAAELGPLSCVPNRDGDADLARVDSALCYEHATCTARCHKMSTTAMRVRIDKVPPAVPKSIIRMLDKVKSQAMKGMTLAVSLIC